MDTNTANDSSRADGVTLSAREFVEKRFDTHIEAGMCVVRDGDGTLIQTIEAERWRARGGGTVKYHKGYNYALRTAKRALNQMIALWMDGSTFDELWPVFEPLDHLRYVVPADDLAQAPITQAMKILHSAAQEDYEAEVIAEYWASR